MFDDRENLIGLLLLGLCAVVGGVLVWEIATGNRLSYNGPGWLVWLLLIVLVGGSLFGLGRGGVFRRWQTGRQWPDPQTGRRPWWRRWFGGGDDDPGVR
jgi:hypothetical protein